MTLIETLQDIVNRLREGRFPNEQAISQGVVLRVLNDLGWDTFDPTLVWPEYQTGEGRADFALCHPPSKAAVLIEVKQPGKANDAVRQALGYAFHSGVPFVVLTDGNTWSFYLPAEQGTYEDRRVYKLDLFEREPAEAAERLSRYLGRSGIESGEALKTARAEYHNRNRQVQARAAMPAAWRELVDSGEELLVDLVADAVETKEGVRPDDEDILSFLASLCRGAEAVPAPPTPVPAAPTQDSTLRRGTLLLRGKQFKYTSAKNAMMIVLNELAKTDPSFLQRCAQHPKAQGRKRKYIARTAEELYPDRPDLQELRELLPGGWYVGTNMNNQIKRTMIRVAAEVAGLEYGRDVVVDF